MNFELTPEDAALIRWLLVDSPIPEARDIVERLQTKPEPEPDLRNVLVHVSRGGLDIGDAIVSKSLNETNDDWNFTVRRAVWRAQRAGNTFTEEDITE